MKALNLCALGLIAAIGVGAAQAADNCTATIHVVYDGATAVALTMNQAAQELYGTPLSDCGSNIKTYRGLRDLDGDGTKDSCVQFYFGQGRGSCEGVQELDLKDGNFDVCTPTSGSTTKVKAQTLKDETNTFLYANYVASDVTADTCAPVITGGLTRPSIFTDTQSKLFAQPFVWLVNKNLRNILPAARVIAPLSTSNCPAGYTDCPRLDFSISREQLKGIYGNNNYCDWRQLDPQVSSSSSPIPVIGAVTRNRLSGTRRTFDTNALETIGMGQGAIFETGTGNVITDVNTNFWCGASGGGAKCGESNTGVIGGQTSPCQSLGSSAISLGSVGADRVKVVDPNTPADPFDDYTVRGNNTDTYDVMSFNGVRFNKAQMRCGGYVYWGYENSYFDNTYHTAGSFREAAVNELNNQLITDAGPDQFDATLAQMFFARSRDGAPVFPSTGYNIFCKQ